VTRDGNAITLGAAMLRRLLAVLLCRGGRAVQVSVLTEALWGEVPPRSARKTLQVYVRRLRQALGEDKRIVHGEGGYAASIMPREMDSRCFEELAELGRHAWQKADLETARALLEEALGLWRGPAYADLGEIPIIADEARRLAEQRSLAHEELVAVNVDLGRHAAVIVELSGMTDELPYRERLCAMLMLSLYRAGRQVDALKVFHRAYATLAEELGVEPGPLLRRVHEYILRDDETLTGSAQEILLHAGGLAPSGPGRAAVIRPNPDRADEGAGPAQDVAAATSGPAMLPADIVDFTGRHEQVELLLDRLSGARRSAAVPVVSVAGRAGVGKTTLAVHVAHRLRTDFPDGQLYADLHGVAGGSRAPADPGEVLGRFLIALGMQARALPAGLEARAESYRALVAGRRVLVVLDNAAGERQVHPLLPGSPTCAVMVTSRRRLGGLSALVLELSGFDPSSARVLLERVAGTAGRVAAEPDAATEITELCGHLPLAIRIAAARLAAREHWSLAHLARVLRDERRRLDELAIGDLSVRASLALGYGTLTAGAKRAFRLLALLDAPTFTAWAAAALLGISAEQADNHIDELLDAGLFSWNGTDACGQHRYRFHDLVRLYARERGEAEETPQQRTAALTRALGAWLALAEAADQRLTERVAADIRGAARRWRMDPATTRLLVADPLAWFDSERSALIACVAQARNAELDELAWELSACMINYLAFRGLHGDWAHAHELALEICTQADNHLGKAVMSRNLGLLRMTGVRTSPLTALDKTDEALTTFQGLGNQHGEVDVLSLRVFSLRHRGDHDQALGCADRAMTEAESIDYMLGQARLWYGRALIHREQGRYERAITCARASLDLAKQTGTAHERVLALWEWAAACRDEETACQVMHRLCDGIAECDRRNERLLKAYLQLSLGDLHRRYKWPGARDLLMSGLSVMNKHAVLVGQSVGLRMLGQLDDNDNRPDRALTHLTKAVELTALLRNTHEQALACTALGHAHNNRGAHDAAKNAWHNAHRLFEQISNTTEAAALRALLRRAAR
jgi:DNA-binding SARP family transcriptional activator